jgi:hypothetical protein
MKALALLLLLATPLQAADVLEAKGAQIRVLDKLSGVVSDYDLAVGQRQAEGRLSVQLDDCRYPADLPSGEAYAHLTITDSAVSVFKGWMIASSPALSALDHPRFDVWVLRCDVPQAADAAAPDAASAADPDANNPDTAYPDATEDGSNP